MAIDYTLQKALYCDLQDIYDMQIAYMKRNKLNVDKAEIKETISSAFINGAIYYIARSDGTKVGSFCVRMEEQTISMYRCRHTVPMLSFSNVITASSLQYVCEAVRDGIEFIQQQYALVIGVNGLAISAIEMYNNSAVSKLVFKTLTYYDTRVSDTIITTFLLHRFYEPESEHPAESFMQPTEILDVVRRMQKIGEDVLQ